mmetsp:Transcript_27884/g.69924  ORF Transcript_27884/g.69924 Transcript_27884/m.69924 type:complete len:284 (-) Transcript_27884:182-1033(-)
MQRVNFPQWVEENKKFFQPPVCNKLIWGNGQEKVMVVGGPNTRSDYHVEEGEELFYQVKGDMCLKIVECGKHKDIIIKEGEMFILPGKIPHSPQRFENTAGLVLERDRKSSEFDILRWYVSGTTDILYQEHFHCTDLGTQLIPVIQRFQSSQECQTGKPIKEYTDPFAVDTTTTVRPPQAFKTWIEEQKTSKGTGVFRFPAHREYQVDVVVGAASPLSEPSKCSGEVLLWQLEGKSKVEFRGSDGSAESGELVPGDMALLPDMSSYQLNGDEDCVVVVVSLTL